jgi:hypothetical protein
MNLHERCLSVLACKWVDEVIMGSPKVLTADLITTFNIDLVVRGTVSETGGHSTPGSPPGSSDGSGQQAEVGGQQQQQGGEVAPAGGSGGGGNLQSHNSNNSGNNHVVTEQVGAVC